MYDDEYFEHGGAWVCGFWEGSYVANEAKLRREAKSTLSLLPDGAGLRLLEIGSAGGFFLDEARAAGFDVKGVELNNTMAEWARSKLNLQVFNGRFEDASFRPGSFEVIVAQDVLEHVCIPKEFVANVARLLAPGGLFLVRGPLEQSWKESFFQVLRKVRRRLVVDAAPPYHLQGFVRRSFRDLVESSGLSLTRFEARALAPRIEVRSLKGAVAGVIELVAFGANVLTARGDFMIGIATRPGAGVNTTDRELRIQVVRSEMPVENSSALPDYTRRISDQKDQRTTDRT
ncbi:MAG: class I SAM-dependent methyltransferase [Gemmatimonadota bacterium]